MTRYTVDAVAMSRYLVDRLPPAANKIFERAENGLDVIEATSVTVSEAVNSVAKKEKIADIPVDTTPNAVLRGLVNNGPVRVVSGDEQDLAVFGSLVNHNTLHDALLIANHRVRGTEAIITSDSAFAGEATVWD